MFEIQRFFCIMYYTLKWRESVKDRKRKGKTHGFPVEYKLLPKT